MERLSFYESLPFAAAVKNEKELYVNSALAKLAEKGEVESFFYPEGGDLPENGFALFKGGRYIVKRSDTEEGKLLCLIRTTDEIPSYLKKVNHISSVMTDEVAEMLTSVSMMQRLFPENEKFGKYCAMLRQSCDKLQRSLKNAEACSKEESENFKQIELYPLLSELADAIDSMLGASAPEINVTVKGIDSLVMVDRELFNLLVLNIISNSLRHSKAGEIRIKLDCTDNNNLILRLEDDGIGLPAGTLESSLTDSGATEGSGLSAVKRIADIHHADISVNSSGGGTSIVIALPRVQKMTYTVFRSSISDWFGGNDGIRMLLSDAIGYDNYL